MDKYGKNHQRSTWTLGDYFTWEYKINTKTSCELYIVYTLCGMWRLASTCASAQCIQNLRCLPMASIDTILPVRKHCWLMSQWKGHRLIFTDRRTPMTGSLAIRWISKLTICSNNNNNNNNIPPYQMFTRQRLSIFTVPKVTSSATLWSSKLKGKTAGSRLALMSCQLASP